MLDDDDLAAKRVLARLAETRGIEFVSSRGATALAHAAASYLLRIHEQPSRADRFADWLMDQVEVADLFVDDAMLERVLTEEWDGKAREPAPTAVARNEALEQALVENPDDIELHLVYGDWLQERGDPYGELVARQVAAAGPDAPAALEREAGSFLDAHAAELLGPMAQYLRKVVHLRWSMGFIRGARVAREPSDDDTYQGPIILGWVLEHRASFLLRELEIGGFGYRAREQIAEMVARLAREPMLTLESLTIDPGEQPGYHPTVAGDLRPLAAVAPRLRTLRVRTSAATIGGLDFPELRVLELGIRLNPEPAAKVLGSSLPHLESLSLGNIADLDALRTVLDARTWPTVRHLRVRPTLDFLDRLARSPLLPRLETLDLRGSDLDGDAAEVLVTLAPRFAHLRSLSLDDNQFSESDAAAISRSIASAQLGVQHPGHFDDEHDQDDDYYDDVLE